ncbi:MAG: AsmA family protein, partial [Pseudomonadota bacterium]
EDRLKGLLADHVERDSGRRIDIRGDLKVRLFPGIRLEAEQVEISGPEDYQGPSLLQAEFLEMNLRLLPMIRGELQASEVRLRGAELNLHADSGGISSLEGLLETNPNPDQSESWLDGPVQVDDVLVNLSDSLGGRQEEFSVDQIELNGFALGEPLEFRFRGNVGDPALFDWLEIDALMLPQDEGRFRLANMRLIGAMESGHFDIEILGNLDVQPGPPLSVSLDSGQLRINEHEFVSELQYTAFDQPYINMTLNAEMIDLDVARLPSLLAGQLGADSQSRVISGLQAMDFDLDVKIGQVAQTGLVLKDLEMTAQARDRRLAVDRLAAEVPGGFLSALGVVNMAPSGWSSELGLRVDADDFGRLASSVPVDWAPSGSGAFSMALVLSSGTTGLEMTGQGAVELWNGQWPVLQSLVPSIWLDSASDTFEFLSTPIEINNGEFILSEFQMVSEEMVAQGELRSDWPPESLAGVLDLTREEDFARIQITGTLNEPEVVWLRPEAGDDP